MNAFSIEMLPSYRMGSWLLGAHVDYRLQGQNKKASEVSDTNMRGQGYLLGLGARYEFSEKLFAQAAVDFVGKYCLKQKSSAGADTRLGSPVGFRLKTGYAFLPQIPNLSFDADIQYLMFTKLNSGAQLSHKTQQFMAAVGVTYVFGFGEKTGFSDESDGQ